MSSRFISRSLRGLGSTGVPPVPAGVPPDGLRKPIDGQVNGKLHVGDSAGRRAEQAGRLCYPSRCRTPIVLLQILSLALLPLALRGAESPDAIRVPLKRFADRPCVRAIVNGHPLWLVIDTGSAVSVLEASAARECGLDCQPGGARAAGMLGTEALLRTAPYAAQIGALPFHARPWFVRQYEAPRSADRALLQPAVEFNLLGMDRLITTCRYLTLDGRKGGAVFGMQRFHPEPGAAYTTAPLEMRRGVPYVELSAGAARFSCLVDTGSSVGLLLDPAAASGLDARTFRTTGGRALGLGSQPSARTKVWSTTLPEVTLGTGVLSKVETLILQHPPALGYSALDHAAVTFDFEGKRLWIRR